ncbi:helix-turn-helix transcriptional regulator [Streptomyces sp. NPDC001552]|uniref:helix-turn-helix transcriptional regulator n=1 Tax=Streptomyces sp. NPDC001552 TaxID=3364587 RepID=UPI0036BF2CF4
MPEEEHQEERGDELLTIAQITQEFGISRQALHTLRAQGLFPASETAPGSTRQKWRKSVVAEFFAANPKRPGTRTDLYPRQSGPAATD